jgi:hypothetical protein
MKQPLYWLAHRELVVVTAALVIYLVLFLVDRPLWLVAALGIAFVVLSVLGVLLNLCGTRHERNKRPCLHCIRDFPLNGGAQISRFRTLLSVVLLHLTSLILILDFLVAGTLLGIWLAAHQVWAFVALFGSISVTNVVIAYVTQRHRQFEPWCPVCHPPEGWNSGAPVGDPDPSMIKTA